MSNEHVLELLDRHLAAENAHDLASTLAGVDTIVAATTEAGPR